MDKFRNCLKYAIVALLAAAASPTAAAISSVEHQEAMRRVDAEYHRAHGQCGKLASGQQDACRTRAEDARRKAKAEADAAYHAADAKRDSRVAGAKADRADAKAQCDALSGEQKQACRREARAEKNAEVIAAQNDAGEEKRDNDFRMEMKRCEALSAGARQSCVAKAQAQFGRK